MTSTPAERCARLAATAIDRLVEIGVPMDAIVKAHVAAAAESTPVITAPATDAQLMTSAVALLAAMSAGRPEYAAAVGALIPALTTRAEALTQAQPTNVIAAQQLFPQHTR